MNKKELKQKDCETNKEWKQINSVIRAVVSKKKDLKTMEINMEMLKSRHVLDIVLCLMYV